MVVGNAHCVFSFVALVVLLLGAQGCMKRKDPRLEKLATASAMVKQSARLMEPEAAFRNDSMFVDVVVGAMGAYVKGLPGGEHDLELYKVPGRSVPVELVPAGMLPEWPTDIGLFLHSPGRPWSVVIRHELEAKQANIDSYGEDIGKWVETRNLFGR